MSPASQQSPAAHSTDPEALHCSPGLSLLSCSGLLQRYLFKYLALNSVQALRCTCTAGKDACMSGQRELRARAQVRVALQSSRAAWKAAEVHTLQAVLPYGSRESFQAPDQHVLRQLSAQASVLAAVRRGQLQPVREACMAFVRNANTDPGHSGWSGHSSLLSPDATCAALLDSTRDRIGLKVVQLPAGTDLALQLGLAGAAAQLGPQMPPVALGFSDSSAHLGVLDLRPNAIGDWDIVAQIWDTRAAAWGHISVLGEVDPGSSLCCGLSFASDETMAAGAVLEPTHPANPSGGLTHIMLFAVPDVSVFGSFPSSSAHLACIAWAPGRHTLLAAGKGDVMIASVSPFKDSADPQAHFQFAVRRIEVPGGRFEGLAFIMRAAGPMTLAACSLTEGQDSSLRYASVFAIEHVAPEDPAAITLRPIHEHSQPVVGAVSLHCTGPSMALSCDTQVSVLCHRRLGGNMLAQDRWSAEGLVQVAWEPVFGHFLAGIMASAVVVLDRDGAQVAFWVPARMPGGSFSKERALKALSVSWIGSKRLAVKCGVGSSKNGVWPALLWSTLEFQ